MMMRPPPRPKTTAARPQAAKIKVPLVIPLDQLQTRLALLTVRGSVALRKPYIIGGAAAAAFGAAGKTLIRRHLTITTIRTIIHHNPFHSSPLQLVTHYLSISARRRNTPSPPYIRYPGPGPLEPLPDVHLKRGYG